MAILFAIFGAVLNTGNDLVYRRSAFGLGMPTILTFYFFAAVASLAFGGVGALISSGFASDPREMMFGAGIGMISFCGYLFFLMSLSGGSASVSVTIFRLNMIPAIVLAALILGERIGLERGAGIILCVVSIYLLAGSDKTSDGVSRMQILLSIGALLFGGTATFLNKVATNHDYDSFHLLFWRYVVVAIVSGIALSIMRAWAPRRDHATFAPLSGLFMSASVFFILEALSNGDLSMVMPITQLSFVFVTFVSGSLVAVIAVL